MKKSNNLTKAAFGIDIVALIALLIYFIAVAPYPPVGLGGLLILSPPLFGLIGLITAILGQIKDKTKFSIVLIIINIIFLCWWPIIWYGGTLLLGP